MSVFIDNDAWQGFVADQWAQKAQGNIADQWHVEVQGRLPQLVQDAQNRAAAIEQQRQQLAVQGASTLAGGAGAATGYAQAAREALAQQQAQQWTRRAFDTVASKLAGVDLSQVKLLPTDPRGLPSSARANFVAVAHDAATWHGIDPTIFVKQVNQASGFDPSPNVAPDGTVGIARLLPGEAQQWGVDPTDPLNSLHALAGAMADYTRRYHGDMARALAAYAAGPDNVDKFSPDVPPIDQTQKYVQSVLSDGPRYVAPPKHPDEVADRILAQMPNEYELLARLAVAEVSPASGSGVLA